MRRGQCVLLSNQGLLGRLVRTYFGGSDRSMLNTDRHFITSSFGLAPMHMAKGFITNSRMFGGRNAEIDLFWEIGPRLGFYPRKKFINKVLYSFQSAQSISKLLPWQYVMDSDTALPSSDALHMNLERMVKDVHAITEGLGASWKAAFVASFLTEILPCLLDCMFLSPRFRRDDALMDAIRKGFISLSCATQWCKAV